MRLFVALVPPPYVLDELEDFLAPYRSGPPEGLRWVGREQLHVTLTFLGEVDERTFERLLPRLQRAVARHRRLTLSLAGAGAFPGNGAHARVLWSGLYGDRRELARLAASTSAAGRRLGVPPGKSRAFRPHLTLARCRVPVDVRPLLEPMSAFAGTPWTADSVRLMESRLPAKGRTTVEHEVISTWPLREPKG
ncbi:RNA 2',3'-cyclic phosphodiesterase [Actinomadura viridis]|uniref:RNA 2',3'-cyclic phosphodiesterase n=1 Tax=Actinomadura viridis TaxID=58110 RepID=A0A931DT38_9ACTN|nr:RNA 2',3'-cyclic phosphodiesterase [Actinomadura viridis]MBG6093432.1 2'-5' RNA ligase [Actinomadura viridis]